MRPHVHAPLTASLRAWPRRTAVRSPCAASAPPKPWSRSRPPRPHPAAPRATRPRPRTSPCKLALTAGAKFPFPSHRPRQPHGKAVLSQTKGEGVTWQKAEGEGGDRAILRPRRTTTTAANPSCCSASSCSAIESSRGAPHCAPHSLCASLCPLGTRRCGRTGCGIRSRSTPRTPRTPSRVGRRPPPSSPSAELSLAGW